MARIDMAQREKLRDVERRAAAYDPDALYELAQIYENPPEWSWIEKDLDEALWYYCASVWAAYKLGKNYRASAYNAGRLLYYGTGNQQDTQLGYHYFKFASDFGHSVATYLLGVYHASLTNSMDHGCGFPRNPYLGFNFLLKAAEMGYVNAMFEVAICYDEGIGCIPNKYAATEWSVKAAEKGNISAMYNAGHFYEWQYDYKKAGYWFNEALQHGHPDAAKRLRNYKYSKMFNSWSYIGK